MTSPSQTNSSIISRSVSSFVSRPATRRSPSRHTLTWEQQARPSPPTPTLLPRRRPRRRCRAPARRREMDLDPPLHRLCRFTRSRFILSRHRRALVLIFTCIMDCATLSSSSKWHIRDPLKFNQLLTFLRCSSPSLSKLPWPPSSVPA